MKSATGVQPEIIFLSFTSAFFDVHVNLKRARKAILLLGAIMCQQVPCQIET